MNGLAAHLLLAIAWMLMTESFTPASLAVGLLVGFAILWLVGTTQGRYARRVVRLVRLCGFIAWESVRANLRVARHVLSPLERLRPVVVAVPLEASTDLEITLLAIVVTVVPGSFVLDVDLERRTLFVHVMHADDLDAARREITDDFERRLLEVLR